MPMYDYKCPTCASQREVMLKLADLSSPVLCQKCGQHMNRKVSAPFIIGDYPPYECPVTGKMIEGRKAHEENLKRTGCRVLEPGETDSYIKSKARDEAKFDAAIEETADRFITELPTDKRDRLAGEMEGGITAELVRDTPSLGAAV